MRKKMVFLILFAVTLTMSSISFADYIVDTGEPTIPPGGGGVTIYSNQWLAAKFSIDKSYTITNIQGFIVVYSGGFLDIVIYEGDDEIPNIKNEIYHSTFSIPSAQAANWCGLSNLEWELEAGTYWVAFEARTPGFEGGMITSSPNPLGDEAWYGESSSSYTGYNPGDYLDLGIRIQAYLNETGPNSPIINSFSTDPDPATGFPPLPVIFTCIAYDTDGSIQSYSLDFGDGTKPETNLTGIFSYTYYISGTYQATCSVVDDEDAIAVSSPITINVEQLTQAPSPPKMLSPINYEIIDPTDVELSWKSSSDDDDLPYSGFNYCVTVKEDSESKEIFAFTGCDDNVFDFYRIPYTEEITTKLPIQLKSGKNYLWNVKAIDVQGNSSEYNDEWKGFITKGEDTGIDSDGDGLPDDWELYGVDFKIVEIQCNIDDVDEDYDNLPQDCNNKGVTRDNFIDTFLDIDNNGTIIREGYRIQKPIKFVKSDSNIAPDLNLPEMGADPKTPDIFIEIDYLRNEETNAYCGFKSADQIEEIVKVFKKNKVNIHIDAGEYSIMKCEYDEENDTIFNIVTWGNNRTRNDAIPWNSDNDFIYTSPPTITDQLFWQRFDNLYRNKYFTTERKGIFRYCFFGNKLAYPGNTNTSGFSGLGEFVVTLGASTPEKENEKIPQSDIQIRTFMHELGHNLGLGHGGPKSIASDEQININNKPNYISVMNYYFQMNGISKFNEIKPISDYSGFKLITLDENNLDETKKLIFENGQNDTEYEYNIDGYNSFYYGPDGIHKILDIAVNDKIDWNLDNEYHSSVSANINGSAETAPQILVGYKDWGNLVFHDGGIGQFGVNYVEYNYEPISASLTIDELQAVKKDYGILISSFSNKLYLPVGEITPIEIYTKNIGLLPNTFYVTIEDKFGAFSLANDPVIVTLLPEEERIIEIPISIPINTCEKENDIVKTSAKADNFQIVYDSFDIEIIAEDKNPPEIEFNLSPNVLWPPNHRMVSVTPTVNATDNCDPSPSYSLVSIVMNEGDETDTFDPEYDYTQGDGNTDDDIQVDENGNIFLRAERSGKSDGRVYTLTYKAMDSSGNSSTATATVTVPHDIK